LVIDFCREVWRLVVIDQDGRIGIGVVEDEIEEPQ